MISSLTSRRHRSSRVVSAEPARRAKREAHVNGRLWVGGQPHIYLILHRSVGVGIHPSREHLGRCQWIASHRDSDLHVELARRIHEDRDIRSVCRAQRHRSICRHPLHQFMRWHDVMPSQEPAHNGVV